MFDINRIYSRLPMSGGPRGARLTRAQWHASNKGARTRSSVLVEVVVGFVGRGPRVERSGGGGRGLVVQGRAGAARCPNVQGRAKETLFTASPRNQLGHLPKAPKRNSLFPQERWSR